MSEIFHRHSSLETDAVAWTEVPIPCGLQQVDVECIDTGAGDAGLAIVVVYDRDPSGESGRVGYKPIPADAVHELTAPHIPAKVWARPVATGSTTPVLMLTCYPKIAACGCKGKE